MMYLGPRSELSRLSYLRWGRGLVSEPILNVHIAFGFEVDGWFFIIQIYTPCVCKV